MRLVDDLAANRIYYGRSLPTLPDILIIDVPSRYAGSGLGMDRYYPVILETVAELHEFEAFLCATRKAPVAPDLLDRRPSSLRSDDIIFARYAPPTEPWPWLLLCRWPPSYTFMVPPASDNFARDAYTIDMFLTPEDVADAERKLLAALGPHEARHVTSVTMTAGHA